MLNKMIHWALASRALVIGVAIILMVMGLKTATELPVEVLPDLTKPTVIILTESPGLAPEEVEMRVTQPLESALMGVAGLTRLRSNSDVSLWPHSWVRFCWSGCDPRSRKASPATCRRAKFAHSLIGRSSVAFKASRVSRKSSTWAAE